MNLKIVAGIVTLSILTALSTIPPVTASNPIYIRGDGRVNPVTAPLASQDNVTYTVTDTIYEEIVVEKSDIVIDGNGFTLEGKGSGTGVHLSNVNNVTIKNVEITKFHRGIWIDSSSHTTIKGNTITHNGQYGVCLTASSNSLIAENTITQHTWETICFSVYLQSSNANSLVGNIITHNDGYGLYLNTSANNLIADNTITHNVWEKHHSYGLYLASSPHNTILGNTVANNTWGGLYLTYASNNTLSGNYITSNNYGGIYLQYSNQSKIVENTSTNNEGYGIIVKSFSNGNMIEGNNVTDNAGRGVYLEASENITVSKNTIRNNIWGGIDLVRASYSTISGNRVINNGGGIYLWNASHNAIYHNHFISNANQFSVSHGHENRWDHGYPAGGNYWSDYADRYPDAREIEDSGIWNTPYRINDDNQDNYPLLPPYTAPPTLALLSPTNTTYLETSVPITFTVTEAPAWICYSLNGQPNVTIAGNITLSGLAKGTNYLTVYVTDQAGNVGVSPVSFTIQLQQEPTPLNAVQWFVAVTVIIGVVAATIFVVQSARRKNKKLKVANTTEDLPDNDRVKK